MVRDPVSGQLHRTPSWLSFGSAASDDTGDEDAIHSAVPPGPALGPAVAAAATLAAEGSEGQPPPVKVGGAEAWASRAAHVWVGGMPSVGVGSRLTCFASSGTTLALV